MVNRTLVSEHTGKTYVRVNKTVARRLHNEGATIFVSPCKVNPYSPWGCLSQITPDVDFEFNINAFIYYNCNSVVGTYPAYYVAQ